MSHLDRIILSNVRNTPLDSLKDVQNMSLRLSIDGEKSSLNSSLDYTVAASVDPEMQDQVKRVLSKIKRPENGSQALQSEKKALDNNNNNVVNKYPMLRRRSRLIVIALDCYDESGAPEPKMIKLMQDIINCARLDAQFARFTGFALSTAMPMLETVEFLKSGNIHVGEFDALICSSGSEVYYPGSYAEEDGKLIPDQDYASHIELNLINMYVILGETGDTDYEELISGAHKTLIMKGVVEKGSEELLRTSGSYLKADIVPGESPLIVYTSGDQVTADEIASAIKDVSKSASGM